MDIFLDKVFELSFGRTLKFVTDKNKSKITRTIVFTSITILSFAVMILLLYATTYFKNIFIWVTLISCSLILLTTVFTFIKKVVDYKKSIENGVDKN